MLKLDSVIDALITEIKADDYFSGISVVKAYPCTPAPTRMTKETVALGIDEISFESMSVDENSRCGSVTAFIDVFVPIKTGSSRAVDIFTRLCGCFNSYNILSVRCERMTVDVNTASYLLKSAFTFNNEIGVI